MFINPVLTLQINTYNDIIPIIDCHLIAGSSSHVFPKVDVHVLDMDIQSGGILLCVTDKIRHVDGDIDLYSRA